MKSLFISLLALVSLGLFAARPAAAEPPPRQLVLNGHGEVKLAPDMAVVDIGVESNGNTAKVALESNTKDMAALMALLKASGIEDKDVQTSNFTVQPRYDGRANQNPPKIVGYVVGNSVTVLVRKLDDLGGLLDKAVSSGSNQVSNISFTVAKPQAAQDEARKAAVADALHKAQLLTDAAGVKLGKLQSMSEHGGGVMAPMAKMARMQAAAPMAADSMPVPVAQGQVSVSTDVSMVWEME